MSDDEIAGMLKDSMRTSRMTRYERALKESQVDAQRLIEAVRSALAADGELLSADELARVEQGIVKLQGARVR
jgi:molecular chaperone HscA